MNEWIMDSYFCSSVCDVSSDCVLFCDVRRRSWKGLTNSAACCQLVWMIRVRHSLTSMYQRSLLCFARKLMPLKSVHLLESVLPRSRQLC